MSMLATGGSVVADPGPVRRTRFWARLHGAQGSAEELCRSFCNDFGELVPGGTRLDPPGKLAEGAALSLPVGGGLRLHCDEIGDRRVTLTVEEAQPRAGLIRFFFDPQRSGVLFETEVLAGPAAYDRLIAAPAGAPRASVWHDVVRRVVDLSGGSAPDGVQDGHEELDEDELLQLEEELESMIRRRKRARAAANAAGA